MRKIILGLITTFGISVVTFGQATLEHSYQTKKWQYEQTNAFKTDAGLNFYTLDDSTGILLVYNASHNLIKTINIPIPSGYTINYLYGITDKLFNADALIEFIICFNYENGGDNPDILTLINENGTILQQYGNKSEAYFIKGTGGAFKMITVSNPYSQFPTVNNFFEYDVYSLPGTTLNVLQNKSAENSFFGFPNPTENKIAITNNLENGQIGTLEVFDTNGKKVMQKNVFGENGEINLDVTELSNGVYIYKLNGQTNRFIKK
jgi:hypothetical protein